MQPVLADGWSDDTLRQVSAAAKTKSTTKKLEIRQGLGMQFRLWEGGSEGEAQVGGGWGKRDMGRGGHLSAQGHHGGRDAAIREGSVFRSVSKGACIMPFPCSPNSQPHNRVVACLLS